MDVSWLFKAGLCASKALHQLPRVNSYTAEIFPKIIGAGKIRLLVGDKKNIFGLKEIGFWKYQDYSYTLSR